jgi:DnaJ family protein B protein 12
LDLLIFFTGEGMMWKARNFGDQDLFLKAKNLETPSCKKLQDLQA